MRRSSVVIALLLILLFTGTGTFAQSFSGCGILVLGVEGGCVIFVSDSQVDYLVFGDTSPFGIGDRLHITGDLDPFCVTTCMQGSGCLWVGSVAPCGPCCADRVGDANGVGGDEPTIGDASVMIDAKFITGTCDGILECLTEADINQTGGSDPTCDDITIGDISILIDYLFITGPTLGLPDCL